MGLTSILAGLSPLSIGPSDVQIPEPIAPARPGGGTVTAPIQIGDITGTFHGSQADMNQIAQNALDFFTHSSTSPSSQSSLPFWLPSNVVAILLGAIFIAGGIFMFKQTQIIIEGAKSAAQRAAVLAA